MEEKHLNKIRLVLSHPTGNENVRAAAKGFLDSGILGRFYTSFASFPGTFLDAIGKFGAFSEIRRRRFHPGLKKLTHIFPLVELGRIMATKAGWKKSTQHETGRFSIDAVYRHQDKAVATRIKKLANDGVTAIYCYEDGALRSFTEAKKLNMACLYDLPIGYWKVSRQLMKLEKEKWPEWAATIKGLDDSQKKLDQKDEELCKADAIFVASRFTAATLDSYQGKLAGVHVIPYGFPPVIKERDYQNMHGRPLNLLFVGSLTQRKGIADLFEAVNNIGQQVRLTVIGRKVTNHCPALDKQLAKHNWIASLSHAEILKTMRSHDVLVFPSLFEGFGLVITEAMSQGTPVITTERTAGPDLIDHDRNGWLIEAGSAPALQNVIENLLHAPDKVATAGHAAMDTAGKRPWDVYGKELAHAVTKIK